MTQPTQQQKDETVQRILETDGVQVHTPGVPGFNLVDIEALQAVLRDYQEMREMLEEDACAIDFRNDNGELGRTVLDDEFGWRLFMPSAINEGEQEETGDYYASPLEAYMGWKNHEKK